jgi:hypothetical protein
VAQREEEGYKEKFCKKKEEAAPSSRLTLTIETSNNLHLFVLK